ncbi:MAG: hypothetical protein RL477_282 [Pseudomonadota bacterium]|jgi:hypothetical protein
MPILAPSPLHAAPTPAGKPAANPAAAGGGAQAEAPAKDGGFSFADLLDIINPLQHIPVVGAIYREITGDAIGTAAKIAGGTLFGGVIGFVTSLVDGIVTEATGKDTAQHLVATLRSGEADYGSDGIGGTDVAMLDNAAPRSGDNAAPRESGEARNSGAQVAARAEDVGDAPDDGTPWLDGFAEDNTFIAPAQLRRAQVAPAAIPVAAVPPAASGRTVMDEARARGRLYQSQYESQERPMQSSVSLSGVRGAAFTGLPSPQVLAANPEMIAAARSPAKAEADGKTVEAASAGWIRLMQAANGTQGSSGLANATVAKAMASYGAGGMTRSPMSAMMGAARQ